MRNTKKLTFTLSALLSASICLSGCANKPETTEVDGVKVAQSTQETPLSEESSQKHSATLADFPTHLSWDLQKEDNHLHIDADVIVPEGMTTLYTGTVEMEPWAEEKKQKITEQFQKAGLIPNDGIIEFFPMEESQISLIYNNDTLLTEEKNGVLAKSDKNSTNLSKEKICKIFNDLGFSVTLDPLIAKGEEWDGTAYDFTQFYENLPVSKGFPTTGINEIIEVNGTVSIYNEDMFSLNVYNLFQVVDREAYDTFADIDTIQSSLQRAVDNYEIVFSKGITCLQIRLEYLLKNTGTKIQLIPVWNFIFDLDEYYRYLDEHPKEREKLSMSNLCINALDGSVAYAV